MTSQDFGWLRWLVAAPPSFSQWRRLCLALEDWPDDVFDAQLHPYLEGHLAHWPDDLRFAPARWLATILDGRPVPAALKLARTLRKPPSARVPNPSYVGYPDDPGRFWSKELITAETLPRLLAHPTLQSLTTLDLPYSPEGDALIAAIAAAPMPMLRALHVRHGAMTERGLRDLTQMPSAAGIQHLTLGPRQPVDQALRALFEAWPFDALTSLTLNDAVKHPDTLQALTSHPQVAGLRSLTLSGAAACDATLTGLRDAPGSLTLQSLRLRPNRFGAPDLTHVGLDALGQLNAQTPLRRLELRHCTALDGEALLKLLNSPVMASLESLDIPESPNIREGLSEATKRYPAPHETLHTLRAFRSGLTNFALATLMRRLPALTTLELNENPLSGLRLLLKMTTPTHLSLNFVEIGDKGLKELAEHPHSAHLETLSLMRVKASARGVDALARSPHMSALRHLTLAGDPIGDEGLRAIAESPHLRDLKTLRLASTDAGARGVEAIASCAWPQLSELTLRDASLDAPAARTLAQAPWVPDLDLLILPARAQCTDDALRIIGQAPIPRRHKEDLRSEPDPWRWTLLDAAHRPASDEALKALKDKIAQLLPGEATSDSHDDVKLAISRHWPAPWREQALDALNEAFS